MNKLNSMANIPTYTSVQCHLHSLMSENIGLENVHPKYSKNCSYQQHNQSQLISSFIVFLPEWKEPNLQCINRIEESHFKRKSVVVPGMAHEFRHGYQHVLPK